MYLYMLEINSTNCTRLMQNSTFKISNYIRYALVVSLFFFATFFVVDQNTYRFSKVCHQIQSQCLGKTGILPNRIFNYSDECIGSNDVRNNSYPILITLASLIANPQQIFCYVRSVVDIITINSNIKWCATSSVVLTLSALLSNTATYHSSQTIVGGGEIIFNSEVFTTDSTRFASVIVQPPTYTAINHITNQINGDDMYCIKDF
jgi:hypothetical protein